MTYMYAFDLNNFLKLIHVIAELQVGYGLSLACCLSGLIFTTLFPHQFL